MTVIEITSTGLGGESIIFLGIAFWLIYFAQSYENDWIRLFLKLFSTFVIAVTAYIPLVVSEQADRAGLYELFSFSIMNGLIFFWALWWVVLFYELLTFFVEEKKKKLEGTQ